MLVENAVCSSVDEIFHVVNRRHEIQELRGLKYSVAKQRELLGPFAPIQPVLPFIRTSNGYFMDLRFAPFLDEPSTEESKELEELGHVSLLETSATGKTRAIFDLGRQQHVIYIRCSKEDTTLRVAVSSLKIVMIIKQARFHLTSS